MIKYSQSCICWFFVYYIFVLNFWRWVYICDSVSLFKLTLTSFIENYLCHNPHSFFLYMEYIKPYFWAFGYQPLGKIFLFFHLEVHYIWEKSKKYIQQFLEKSISLLETEWLNLQNQQHLPDISFQIGLQDKFLHIAPSYTKSHLKNYNKL